MKNPHGTRRTGGVLREGKEYSLIVASIDIHDNSALVKKYKSYLIEKEYKKVIEFISRKLHDYNGRVWFWAGDGGIIAFRDEDGPVNALG